MSLTEKDLKLLREKYPLSAGIVKLNLAGGKQTPMADSVRGEMGKAVTNPSPIPLGNGLIKSCCDYPGLQLDSKAKTPEQRLNKTEREFLAKLRSGALGNFDWIGVQSITLLLGFDCRYTPDFATKMPGGDFRFWEVKGGFIRDDAAVKLRVAAHMYPWWTFVKAQKTKGQWTETIVQA